VSLLAFFIAAALLALTPGPGIAYVVARTVAGGRQEGLACWRRLNFDHLCRLNLDQGLLLV
jgi:hypothetical protein